MRKLTLLISCMVFMCCSSFNSSTVAASDEEGAMEVVINWFKAYNTGDYDLMSSLYWHSPKLSIYGPVDFEPFLTQGWEAMDATWKAMCALPEGTFANSIHNPQITMLSNEVAVITAYNTGVVNPPAVKQQVVMNVRETFVVQKIDGRWAIVHAHGSEFPTE